MVHKGTTPDTRDMPNCACPAASLTSLRFADGLVLLRCAAHEQQAWYVDGRPAERHEVLPALKGLFVDRRGERAGRGAPARRVVQLPEAAPALPEDVDSARLTALLRARGLPGDWAVA